MSLAQHRQNLIDAGLMVPNPAEPGKYKYAPGYTVATAAAALREMQGLPPKAPKAPKGLKFATTPEGAQVLVVTKPRIVQTINASYTDKFSDFCAGAENREICERRPGCTWQGGKNNRCQKGTGKTKSQAAQAAEQSAKDLQNIARMYMDRKRMTK